MWGFFSLVCPSWTIIYTFVIFSTKKTSLNMDFNDLIPPTSKKKKKKKKKKKIKQGT